MTSTLGSDQKMLNAIHPQPLRHSVVVTSIRSCSSPTECKSLPTSGLEDAHKLTLEIWVDIYGSNQFRNHFFSLLSLLLQTRNSGQRSAGQTECGHDQSRGGQPLFLSLWAAFVSAGEAAVCHSVAQYTRTFSMVLWWKATRSSAARHSFVYSLRKVKALPGLLHRSCDVGTHTEVAATPQGPRKLQTLRTISPQGQREGR